MQAALKHMVREHVFWVSPERVLFWEDEATLIVSDLHFGKTGHFRKAGIAMPQAVFKEDLQRLITQLQYFSPKQLLVVGDLFHSVANKELDLFCKWRNDLHGISIQLVKGNHDILKDEWYANAGITVVKDELQVKGFCFTHDNHHCRMPAASPANGTHYTISGHIHPGVTVRGPAKQSVCLPCFYFGETSAILPAFSHFTGTATIRPASGDSIFVLVDNNVVKIG